METEMPQIYPQRHQLKHTRKQYRVRNWNEYEAGLRRRGDLSIWFSKDSLRDWHPTDGKKPGGQQRYSDSAIEAALTVHIVYGLALRQTEGFLRSITKLLHLDIEIPDHSTLSRRSATLPQRNVAAITATGPVQILIDSTGLRMHRGSAPPEDERNRRSWRKLHLVVDAKTAEILSAKVTAHDTRDSTPVADLLAPVDRAFASVMADGAYDRASVYDAIEEHAPYSSHSPTRIVIPPGRNARLAADHGVISDQRDGNIRHIARVGRRQWQKESKYNQRSLVETAMSRFKNEFGDGLRSRTMRTQVTEVRIACEILNTMTRLGMPDGHCVA